MKNIFLECGEISHVYTVCEREKEKKRNRFSNY